MSVELLLTAVSPAGGAAAPGVAAGWAPLSAASLTSAGSCAVNNTSLNQHRGNREVSTAMQTVWFVSRIEMFKLQGSRPLNYQSHAWDACSVERWRQSRANILTTGQTKPVRENTVSPDVMHGSRRDLVRHVCCTQFTHVKHPSVTMQISIAGSSVSTVWGVALCLGVTLQTLFETLRRHFECKVDTCKSHVLGQLINEANNRICQICVSLVNAWHFETREFIQLSQRLWLRFQKPYN